MDLWAAVIDVMTDSVNQMESGTILKASLDMPRDQLALGMLTKDFFLNVVLNDVGKIHLLCGYVGTMFYSGVLNCMYATRKASRARTLHSLAVS